LNIKNIKMLKVLKMNINFISIVFCILFFNVSIGQEKRGFQTISKPNIILIVADDLGWGDVGFNGQTKIKTPNIDILAKEGIVFNNFYSGSTVCGPSRASLLTGKHTGHSSVRENPHFTLSGTPVDIQKEDITIAEELKKAGYVCGMIGKWGLAENLKEGRPNKQGFDYFYGFNKHANAHHYYPDSIYLNENRIRIDANNWENKKKNYIQDIFSEKAKMFMTDNKNAPFFLYLAYTTPHYELTVPKDSKEPYLKKDWPLRVMKPKHYLHDKNGHVTYAAMVSRLDKQIGELMEQLKFLELEENTLVIFTSDNGHEYDNVKNEFFNSNGPYRGKKRDLYEGGIKMPFVAKFPNRIKAGTTSNHISSFWDVLPTFCDIAHTPVTTDTDGISFVNALLGNENKQKKQDYLYWEFNERKGPMQAIRKGKWKAVKRFNKKIELYDLEKDISEKNNCALRNPLVIEEGEVLFKTSRTDHPEFPLIKKEKKKHK
jgi:arylsulfatase A-like enzyme